MAVKRNRTSFEYARELVTQEKVVVDERDAWSEDQPSTQEENEFIDAHGDPEYAPGNRGRARRNYDSAVGYRPMHLGTMRMKALETVATPRNEADNGIARHVIAMVVAPGAPNLDLPSARNLARLRAQGHLVTSKKIEQAGEFRRICLLPLF
jgi:hypothetical protein